jgi:hypothetical protein
MSIVDKLKGRAERVTPRLTECVLFARPIPLIGDEKPPAGDEYRFKAVFDPNDPHLAQVEPPERLELMKPFFATGSFVLIAIHIPTDTMVAKMWLLTRSPLPSDAKRGLLPIKLARDEIFILDIWTHPDHRRKAVAFTVAYELDAVVQRYYPHMRWVYGYAHKDNEASRGLMELVYGMWAVQEFTEVEIGDYWVNVVPGSDKPKFGPFSKRGRHSGDGFQVPGRPRSGEGYQRYHHPDGWADAVMEAEVADDWFWVGPEWFDNDHPKDAKGRPAMPETLRRPHRSDS